MITKLLQRWREARRRDYINRILVERAGLRGRLLGYRSAGLAGTPLLGAIAECDELLRQFGYEEPQP